ncbi:phage inhibition, colicin resistance and tellurite resistance protein [Escherichia coli]|nr:phage inhibition, colicin resistance and tellurite resistance protein [Escherichia coli]
MNLQSGQNIPLQQSTIRLNLQYPAKSGFKGEPDTCLFMLNAQGKVMAILTLSFIIICLLLRGSQARYRFAAGQH